MIFKESETIELKEKLTENVEKELIAFVNNGGGKVIIGVADDGTVIGVENPDKIALMIADRIKNNIAPSIMGLFKLEIKSEDDKNYIVVTVVSGLEKPYYLKKYGMSPSGCFIRIGTQSAQMSQTMIDDYFSRRVRNTLHNVISPNQDLTFSQLKIYYEGKGFNTSSSHFIKNLDLYTDDGKYNYAAYLLADNNGTSIKVARFKGKEKLEVLERNEFGRCCLIKSALSVLERLNVINTTSVIINGSALRKEIRLIDEPSLREAVLNAIIHNDYINGSYPVFEIYDDRIEIISSGGLPYGLSKEEFFEGRSLPRNKELMRVFSDMNLGEQLGSGMKKILQVYPQNIFQISDHFIVVKFKYNQEALDISHGKTKR